jgi:hypothetical protein
MCPHTSAKSAFAKLLNLTFAVILQGTAPILKFLFCSFEANMRKIQAPGASLGA